MKEGKVFKRILAIALVVVMTITMVPFGVFATEGTGSTTTTTPCTHEGVRVPANLHAATSPTCTEDGSLAYYLCSCGQKIQFVSDRLVEKTDAELKVNKLGHKWNEGTVTTPATCGAKGTKTFTCSVCNDTKTEEIAKLTTHTWDATTGKCSVCNIDCTHTWTAGKCTVCKKVCAHAGGTATCIAEAICEICGESYGPKAEHTYETAYTEDRAPTCTEAGSESRHCSVATCTAKTGEREIPATGHKFDKTKADGKCTKCTATCDHNDNPAMAIPEVKATCTTDGSNNGFMCADCATVVIKPKKVEALGHDIENIPGVAPTCTEGGKSDGQRCTREGCDYSVAQTTLPALGHSWSTEKKVTLEPTCTTKGSKAIVCTREGCNAIKEGTVEEVDMKAHDWDIKKTIREADCENDGEKAILCKVCKTKKDGSSEKINKLGHDWDDGTVKVPADCTKDGVTTYKCKRTGCGKTEDRKVDKLEHEYKEEKVEATCEKDGYSVFTCQCGDEYIAKKVEKFGHSFITYVQDANTATCYSDGTKTAECDHGCGKKNTIPDEGSKIDHKMTDFTTIKPATCTEEGEEEAKCFYFDQCGYSESYPTDALGHTVTKDTQFTVDKPATCTEKGSQSKHCERCDYTEGTEEIPALGHDFQPAEGTKATCTTGGYAKFKCSRCPETKEEANAEPLGHDFQYVSNNNATCKEDGTETGKCSRCDVVDTRTEAGSKLPHTLGEAVVVPATTEENGSITTKCTVCDEVVEAVEIAKISKLSLKYTVATYDGKTKHPKLTITDANGNVLVKGTDYTVEIPTKEESAKAGKHTYTVTFMGNYEGEEEVSYKVLPGKTSKISSEKKQTEIKLSWKAVKGATGYRVYVYNTKTKKYNIVAKYVKGKTSYTVKDLKANTSYKFAVKAYTKVDGELFWAEESTKVTVKTLVGKTSKITAAPAATSVKLSWKKVSGADGYRVYVYNAKTKSYKILEKNVTGTSYTVKGLKAGTSYKFAVKAYDTVSKKTVWSNQYTTVNVTTKR